MNAFVAPLANPDLPPPHVTNEQLTEDFQTAWIKAHPRSSVDTVISGGVSINGRPDKPTLDAVKQAERDLGKQHSSLDSKGAGTAFGDLPDVSGIKAALAEHQQSAQPTDKPAYNASPNPPPGNKIALS